MGSQRNLAIDRFRGSLVILMVIGDYLSGVAFVPDYFKHAPDVGFTIADTVAPAFVFVIGLNYGTSFARRRTSGLGAAYRYFGLRYLAIIGIGAIIAAGANAVGQPTDWGVLQAIGVAGLITLLVIRFPTWARFLVGALLLAAYQWLLDAFMLDTVLGSVHGGLFGSLSWAALLILSTAVADVWRRGQLRYLICIALLIGAAALTVVFVPVSKNRVSLSFILITLALSAVVFLATEALSRITPQRAGLLCWWGENALLLYVLHLVVLGIFVSPPISWWYVAAPVWLATLQLVVILAMLSMVAWWMHLRRSRNHVKLD